LLLVLDVEDPIPLLEPLTEFELVPPWLVLFSVAALVELELLPLLGCSLVVPAPPSFLLQPISAQAAQTMRINLFIAVVFLSLCLVPYPGSSSFVVPFGTGACQTTR